MVLRRMRSSGFSWVTLAGTRHLKNQFEWKGFNCHVLGILLRLYTENEPNEHTVASNERAHEPFVFAHVPTKRVAKRLASVKGASEHMLAFFGAEKHPILRWRYRPWRQHPGRGVEVGHAPWQSIQEGHRGLLVWSSGGQYAPLVWCPGTMPPETPVAPSLGGWIIHCTMKWSCKNVPKIILSKACVVPEFEVKKLQSCIHPPSCWHSGSAGCNDFESTNKIKCQTIYGSHKHRKTTIRSLQNC